MEFFGKICCCFGDFTPLYTREIRFGMRQLHRKLATVQRLCDTADALYITQRLEPQFKLASEKAFGKTFCIFWKYFRRNSPWKTFAHSWRFMNSIIWFPERKSGFNRSGGFLCFPWNGFGYDAVVRRIWQRYLQKLPCHFPLEEGWQTRGHLTIILSLGASELVWKQLFKRCKNHHQPLCMNC